MATDKLINHTQGESMISELEAIAQNLQAVGSVSLAKLGMGYALCDVAAATAAKTANLANYALNEGGLVTVKFTYANTAASATLNINSTGAKAIYYKGAAIGTDVIKAGDIATFMYSNNIYNLINLDNPFTTDQINALNSGIDSTKVQQIQTNQSNISTVQTDTSLLKNTITTIRFASGTSRTFQSNALHKTEYHKNMIISSLRELKCS